jgi:hypothetical protein
MIHEWITTLGLEHLNEVNTFQHECPKNGRLKQYCHMRYYATVYPHNENQFQKGKHIW